MREEDMKRKLYRVVEGGYNAELQADLMDREGTYVAFISVDTDGKAWEIWHRRMLSDDERHKLDFMYVEEVIELLRMAGYKVEEPRGG